MSRSKGIRGTVSVGCRSSSVPLSVRVASGVGTRGVRYCYGEASIDHYPVVGGIDTDGVLAAAESETDS